MMFIGINKIFKRGCTISIRRLRIQELKRIPCHPPFTVIPGKI
jgi:hypothetical protein